MKYLPLTLIFTLGASLFVAYVISPVQGAQWIDYRKEIRKARENLEHPHWYKKYNPFTIIYHKVDEKFFPWMQDRVRDARCSWTLSSGKRTDDRPFRSPASRSWSSLHLCRLFNKGVVFFPDTQPNLVNVSIEAPPGTSLDVTTPSRATLEERTDRRARRRRHGVRRDERRRAPMIRSTSADRGLPTRASVAINFYEKSKRSQSSVDHARRGARRAVARYPGRGHQGDRNKPWARRWARRSAWRSPARTMPSSPR